MHNKSQTKKMYELARMKETSQSLRMEDNKRLIKMGLIDKPREVKSMSEYHYLLSDSNRIFQGQETAHACWIEGYALNITPILSKENFHLIEFSLENGDFLTFPFALEKGMDGNYQKFLSVIGVQPLDEVVPVNVLVKRLGFLVTPQMVNGKMEYYLHDLCPLEELAEKHTRVRQAEEIQMGGMFA